MVCLVQSTNTADIVSSSLELYTVTVRRYKCIRNIVESCQATRTITFVTLLTTNVKYFQISALRSWNKGHLFIVNTRTKETQKFESSPSNVTRLSRYTFFFGLFFCINVTSCEDHSPMTGKRPGERNYGS